MRAEQRVIAGWLERTREAHGLNWKTWAEKVRLNLGVSMAETTLSRAVKEDFTSVMSVPTLDVLARSIDEPSVLDFLAGKAAGADTPPPAWIPKQTTVVRILEVFGPYAWANLNDEGSLREVADAIASVFGTISNDRAIEDNPDELSGALKSAAYSLRGLPQAPRPSKPSTQRHKSDNS